MNNDLISRSALKEDFKSRLADCNEWIEKAKDKETKSEQVRSRMSVENGKVCCNCKHCKRIQKEHGAVIECRCDRDNAYLTYSTVLGHWCRHWAKEREAEKC